MRPTVLYDEDFVECNRIKSTIGGCRLAETAARIDLSNAKAMEDLETVRSNVSEILTRDYKPSKS